MAKETQTYLENNNVSIDYGADATDDIYIDVCHMDDDDDDSEENVNTDARASLPLSASSPRSQVELDFASREFLEQDLSYSDDDSLAGEKPRRRGGRKCNDIQKEGLRLRVNDRERQRMHGLNSAMDALRQVMPYAQGSSVKKLSKMNTLLLARNYIVLMKRSIDEMKRLLADSYRGPAASLRLGTPAPPRLSALHARNAAKLDGALNVIADHVHRSTGKGPLPGLVSSSLLSSSTRSPFSSSRSSNPEFSLAALPSMTAVSPTLSNTLLMSSKPMLGHLSPHLESSDPCRPYHPPTGHVICPYTGAIPHLGMPSVRAPSLVSRT